MGWDVQYIKLETLAGHKYCVSWVPDINIVYHGYQAQILCIFDTRPKKLCVMDNEHINIVYHRYQT